MNSAEKARKSFNHQCNRASKCRHERYQVSCNSCDDKDICDIQRLIKKAKERLRYQC